MEFSGRVLKTGKGESAWFVECPAFCVVTQGFSKEEALEMLEDAILGLMECYFKKTILKKFRITIIDHGRGKIGVQGSDNKLLTSFALIKQREESGEKIQDIAERLGSSSPNAYKRYETGTINVTMEKYDQLIRALCPGKNLILSFS